MAAACAEYLGADQLIYLTDVAGVLDGERVLSVVTCEEIERLVQCRVVSGGMVLKLEAAKRAIEGGVREVRIVGGTSPGALLLASHAAEASANDRVASIPGTRVLRVPLSAAQAALSAASCALRSKRSPCRVPCASPYIRLRKGPNPMRACSTPRSPFCPLTTATRWA